MNARIQNSYGVWLSDFMKDIYVVCPSCKKQAVVRSPGYLLKRDLENEVRLICTSCGHSKILHETPKPLAFIDRGRPIRRREYYTQGLMDPFFKLPLWLMTECAENLLWAYNYEHLNFLQDHVSAKLRERSGQKMANSSLGSRLPKWMTARKNREAVLNAIQTLKTK